MSQTNLNLINATRKIVGMNRNDLEDMLCQLLADNPTIVLRKLGMGNQTYKVVVDVCPFGKKIMLIKMFRYATRAGLRESKDWTEGISYNGLPSGVFQNHMTRDQAVVLAHSLNSMDPGGVRVKIVPNDEKVIFTPL